MSAFVSRRVIVLNLHVQTGYWHLRGNRNYFAWRLKHGKASIASNSTIMPSPEWSGPAMQHRQRPHIISLSPGTSRVHTRIFYVGKRVKIVYHRVVSCLLVLNSGLPIFCTRGFPSILEPFIFYSPQTAFCATYVDLDRQILSLPLSLWLQN